MQVLMPLDFNKQDKDLIKLVMQKEKNNKHEQKIIEI